MISALLMFMAFTLSDVTSGKWMITEMSNLHQYPRRDISFIGHHIKEFQITPFNKKMFAWEIDIPAFNILRLVNKNKDPGDAHFDSSGVYWYMQEGFYIEI